MGKYLDVAKKFEARRKAEERLSSQRPALPAQSVSSRQEAPTDYRPLYKEMTQALPEDFPLVDAWLVDAHPTLWRQIRELDDELSRLEQERAPEAVYNAKLNEFRTLCHEAKALREGKWGALLVKSELLGCEVWVVRDETALALVKNDECPVFFAEEIELLNGKSLEQVQDILKAKAAFPGCRIIQ